MLFGSLHKKKTSKNSGEKDEIEELKQKEFERTANACVQLDPRTNKYVFKFTHEIDAPLWNEIIIPTLQAKISSFTELKAAIFKNQKKEFNLLCLENALKSFSEEQTNDFYGRIVPFIQKLVLRTEEIFKGRPALPILKKGMNARIVLTRLEAACILANCFFCTYKRVSEEFFWSMTQFPSINFDDLFRETKNTMVKAEKIKMFIHYFGRIEKEALFTSRTEGEQSSASASAAATTTTTTEATSGAEVKSSNNSTIVIERLSLDKSVLPDWSNSKQKLCDFEVFFDGTIEDAGDALQADFANAFIGGGALNYGCVQEEIRFSISPELNCSRLFCEKMDALEAVVITGAEQYCTYLGYGGSLKFGEDFVDKNRDQEGNVKTQIVALDALIFVGIVPMQFKKEQIDRELNKAYAAFYSNKYSTTISTGNWGCGAFCGQKELKSLIQWMAISCSEVPKKMLYYTFKDAKLSKSMPIIMKAIKEKGITVGELYSALLKVKDHLEERQVIPDTYKVLNKMLNLDVTFS